MTENAFNQTLFHAILGIGAARVTRARNWAHWFFSLLLLSTAGTDWNFDLRSLSLGISYSDSTFLLRDGCNSLKMNTLIKSILLC